MASNEYDAMLAAPQGDAPQAATAQPGPAQPTDEYGPAISASRDADKQALQQSMFVAAKTQPDQKAKALDLAQKTKIPVEVVERNFDTISQKHAEAAPDYDRIIDQNPGLTKWFKDPNNASVARDDLDNLGSVEQAIRDHDRSTGMGAALASGMASMYASFARIPALVYNTAALPQNIAANIFDKPEWRTQAPDSVLNNSVAKYYDQAAQAYQTPAMERNILDELSKGNYARAGQAIAHQVVSNAPQQAAIIAGTLLGYEPAVLLGTGATTAAQSQQQAFSSGVDPATATLNVLAKGTFEAGFENLGTMGVLKKWEHAIAHEYGKEVSKRVFKEFASTLGSTAKTLAHTGLAEGNEEFMTSAAQDFTDYVTGVNPDALHGLLGRAVNAGIVGGASGVAMTGPSAIGSGLARGARVRESTLARDLYLAMGKSAESTKLRERLPQAQKDFIQKITGGTSVENIYIPVAAMDGYFQGAKTDNGAPGDPVKAAQDLGILKEYTDAKATGADVKIPLATWVDKVVGTDAYTGLANDVKFNPTGLTMNEQAKAQEESKAQLERAQKDAQPTPAEQTAEQSAKKVGDSIAEQLKANGVDPQAAIVAEKGFHSLATRVGLDPQELFNRYQLHIGQMSDQTAEQSAAQDQSQLDQGPVRDPSQSAHDFLTQEFAKLSPEEQVNHYAVNEDTGTLHERAFQHLTPAPGQQVAHVSVEGIKFANDKYGHEAGDALYRYFGQALLAAHPEVAKVGGDFQMYVDSPEQLQQIIEQAKAALPPTLDIGGKAVSSKSFDLTGSVGPTIEDAKKAHAAQKKMLEETGRRAARGAQPFGLVEQTGAPPAAPAITRAVPNSTLTEKIAGLPAEQRFKDIHFDKNGLLTLDAYKKLPTAKYRASIDLDGLAAINNKYGFKAGNQFLGHFDNVIQKFAKVYAERGVTIDLAHKSGDEYLSQHDDGEKLKQFWLDVEAYLADNKVEFNAQEGQPYVKDGMTLGVGIGGNDAIAEDALRESKDGRKQQRSAERILGGIRPKGAERSADERRVQPDRRTGVVARLDGSPERSGAGERRSGLSGKTGGPQTLNQSALTAPTFYSKLVQTLEQKMGGSATVEQIRAITKDVKEEERKWLGLDDFLKGKEKVKKEDLLNFLRGNALEIKEVTKGGATDVPLGADIVEDPRGTWAIKYYGGGTEGGFASRELAEAALQRATEDLNAPETKFSQYTLPGGENYREVLFTLPAKPLTELPEGHTFQDNTGKPNALKYPDQTWFVKNAAGEVTGMGATQEAALADYQRVEKKDNNYRSSHWDEPNVLAHTRLNDRVDADGKRVLFIEEIQSDWHQEGRKKGYGDPFEKPTQAFSKEEADKIREDFRAKLAPFDEKVQQYPAEKREALYTQMRENPPELKRMIGTIAPSIQEAFNEGAITADDLKQMEAVNAQTFRQPVRTGHVPDAPFKKTWHEFVLKRLIREAAEKGYDKIAWTPGEMQAERYDLSAQVGEVNYKKTEAGTYRVEAFTPDTGSISLPKKEFTKDELEGLLGKDLVSKMDRGEGSTESLTDGKKLGAGFKSLHGADLKLGGEGMKGFYDKMIPDFLNKFGKKFGAKVGETEIKSDADVDIHGDPTSGPSTEVHSMEITPELRKAALEEGFSLFQPGDSGPRGRIHFGSDRKFTIELGKAKDHSTFFHEMGHFYLEVMGDLAHGPEATDQIKQDYQTILSWLGVKDRSEIQTEHHEQWARGFEAYLMEGKAPSFELRGAFARFKVWLISVYRDLGSLKVSLSDDVRRVMDRMLATDDEINAASRELEVQPLFTDPKAMGMSDQMAHRYLDATFWAKEEAKEKLNQRVLEGVKRERDKAWKEKRSALRTEMEKEVSSRPEYRALDALKANSEIRIDRATVDKDLAKKLPFGVLAKKGVGVHADVAASMLGFGSGSELLAHLAAAPKKDALLDQMADSKMRELHPELLGTPQLPEEAMKALHNEKRAELLRMELEHLASNDMPVLKEVIRKVARRMPSKEAVRAQAAKLIGDTNVTQLKPHVYQRAEVKAANEAGKLLASGDIDGAFNSKQRELLNNELYRTTTDAADDVEASREFFKKLDGKDEDLAKTRDMDLVNTARAILAEVGLGKVEKPSSYYVEKIKAYDPEGYATVQALLQSVSEIDRHWSQLSYNEFVTLSDTVKSLWDLARSTRQMEIDGRLVDREQVKEELASRLNELADPGKRPGYDRAKTAWDEAKMSLMGVRAALRRVESWVDAMDNGDPNGVFRKYFFTPISEAATKFRLAKKEQLQKFLELVKPIEKDLVKQDIAAPELGYTFSGKAELLGALLHTGNESNLSKLLRGRNWGTVDEEGALDRSRWDKFVDRLQKSGTLTKADYDFVQGVWDLFESTKPDAQRAHKKMYGHYFNEITADPVVTPFGTYRGGYAPAVADSFMSQDAQIRSEKEVIEKSNNSFMFPTAGRGFTKARVDQYAAPLIMDLRLVPMQIDKALRFIHIEPHVKDVARVVMDKSFRKQLDHFDPTVGGDMLVPWLQRAAQQRVSTPSQGWGGRALDTFFKEVRNRTGLSVMAINVVNTLQNFTGFTIAALRVEPKHLRNALWDYMRAPKDFAKNVSERSEFMRTKLETGSNEVLQQIDELILNPDKYDKARDFAKKNGYVLQTLSQNMIDGVVWGGAYNQAIEQGAPEKQAVREADAAVRLTQSSLAPEDVSRFETGTPFVRAFTQFYSYFNMQANLLGTEFLKTARELGLKKGAGRLLYTYALGFMLPAVLNEVIVKAMSGGLDGNDDEDYLNDFLAAFFGGQFRSATAMFPIVGPAVQAGVNAFNDKWYDDRIATSPAVSMIESAVQSPHSVYQAISGDGPKKRAIRDGLTALSLATGLPFAALSRPAGYLSDVSEGNAQPSGPIDFTRGLMTGKSGKK